MKRDSFEQTPDEDQVFFDHASWFTRDLSAAYKDLLQLGFQISQVNVQYNQAADGSLVPTGTSNRLVFLENGFLEFLSASGNTPLSEQLRAALIRYQGIHLMAFSHCNMELQRQRLIMEGFAMQDVIHMKRPVKTERGTDEVSYSILRTVPGEMNEGRIQFLTANTPSLTWRPGTMEHPNGAKRLTGVLTCVSDLHEVAARYARFTGRCVRIEGNFAVIDLDRGRLTFCTRQALAETLPDCAVPCLPFIAAVSVEVEGIPRLLASIEANSPGCIKMRGKVITAPNAGYGGQIVFHERGVPAWGNF